MSEPRFETFAARPRPLTAAPVERLEGRAQELARRWAIALISARPLTEMAAVPLAEVARIGPTLCAALARALGSEAALDALTDARASQAAAPVAELRALTTRWDAAATVDCIETLRQVVWTAMTNELGEASPSAVAELSDRLAGVCATLLAHVLSGSVAQAAVSEKWAAPAPPQERVLYTSPPLPGGSGAALIDEYDEQQSASSSRASRVASAARPRPLPWDTPMRSPGSANAEVRAVRAGTERVRP